MPTYQQLPLTTLSDVMEVVLEKLGPDLARRGHRMLLHLVDSSTDTGRDLSPVADVIADVLDCAACDALTKRNLVQVAFEDDHIVITVREEIADRGWALARRLTETHGRGISCCSAETALGTEVVVRVQVPVFEPASDESRSSDDVLVRAPVERREFRYRATVARLLLNVRAVQEASRRD